MTHSIADPDLFDRKAFKRALREQERPLSLFKLVLKAGHIYLTEKFITGKDIDILVKQQCWLIDQLLVLAWEHFIDSDQVSLIAVGGYGRSELLLASDIDLMILENPRIKKETIEKIQNFIAFLWDVGLEVGHSVRTVKECRNEAKSDITVMTNIMEARYLCGNTDLFQSMRKATAPNKIWPTRKFFQAKLAEQKTRHKKYSDSGHKLQPNVKESPGGLRDIQMISWVAKRHFDNIKLNGLVKQKFLTTEEYKILTHGRNLLWRIRFALHMTMGRREDRLLFERQRPVAELLGFKGDNNKGTEDFMKMYFKTVREMNRLNEMLLQLFEEDIIYSKRRERIMPINARFQIRNGFIEARHKTIFNKYPFALLEIFLLQQQNSAIKGVKANTIRLIRDNLHLINRKFRKDIRNRSLFLEIIKQPNQVGHKLRQMHQYGILGAYLPSFARIEGLMQFDLFHVYTVDEHTLTVVQNMRLYGTDDYREKFPVCNTIIKKIPKLEVLYFAGLFHDIAKGRGGDHAKLGAKDAYAFCQLHQMSEYDSKLIEWLVEKHLLMSRIAQREDIDDPDVISRFADEVHDQNHLNYLHVMTVADICGTNPELWNSWRATLLNNLYHHTLLEFRRGKEKPLLSNKRIQDTKQEALKLITAKSITGEQIQGFWKTVGNEYFLRHQAEEIAWQTEGVLKHNNSDEPLVLVRNFLSRGGCLIFVCTRGKKNLFPSITKTIEKLRLNIVDAKIISNRKNYALDTFIVLENDGTMVSGKERMEEIKTNIIKEMNSSPRYPKHEKWIRKQHLKSFNIPTQVVFTTDIKKNRTIMEITTMDRPGVLSRISTAMDMCGANLEGAKIATYGERVEDIFYLRNQENKAIDDPIKFECLKNTIIESLTAG